MTSVLIRSGASLAAGAALYFAFPPHGHWWLAPIGIAVLFTVFALPQRTRLRAGFGYGLLAGLGHFVPLLTWIDTMVGPVPWIGLAVACAVFYGAFGMLATQLVRVAGAPLWFAAAFTGAEWARSSFPFGGFPWGRLAFSQGESPLLSLARFGGAPGLSFAVALIGAALGAAALTVWRRQPARGLLVPAVGIALVCLSAAAAWPLVNAPSNRPSMVVAAIQGNVPEQRWDVATQRAVVLANHLEQTRLLANDVRAGRQPQPDVVVWPENSTDVSPERDPDVGARIRAASAQVGAPILVGTIHYDGTGRYYNSMILMGPDGPIERHDKAILQPFGETMPMREFFRIFSDYVDLANNFSPGTGDGVVRPARASRPTLPLGVATCYEVAVDRALRTSVANGAEVLTVPTNNATFGRTGMTWQQLGMSQVRAVEFDRDVIVAATTGVSAFVRPDGTVARHTEIWTGDRLVEQIAPRTARTPASRLGEWGNIALVLLTLCGLSLAIRQDGDRLDRAPSEQGTI